MQTKDLRGFENLGGLVINDMMSKIRTFYKI